MSKLYILLAGMINVPTYCMLTQSQYTQRIKSNNLLLNSKRDILETQDASLAPHIHPGVQFIDYAQNDELAERCDYYAIKTATGSTKSGTFTERVRFLEDRCNQVQKPQPHDIVAYTVSDTDLTVKHFAVVQSVTKHKKKSLFSGKSKPILVFESKWGSHPEILRHTPDAVPTSYGTAYYFFRPK